MQKIALTITTKNGQIIITPPPGIELEINTTTEFDMTVAEAAIKYDVSKNTLAKACDYGNVPSQTRGRIRFVRDDDVAAWKATLKPRGRPAKS